MDGEAAVIFYQDADFDSTLDIAFRVGPVSDANEVASTPPSIGLVDLTLVLQLDQFPAETSWAITSIDGGTVYESRSDGYYESINDNNIVETFRLPGGHAYRFTIKDLLGDGFCESERPALPHFDQLAISLSNSAVSRLGCSEGKGYYSLYANESTLLFHSSADVS